VDRDAVHGGQRHPSGGNARWSRLTHR
jgi:hypothetical protein